MIKSGHNTWPSNTRIILSWWILKLFLGLKSAFSPIELLKWKDIGIPMRHSFVLLSTLLIMKHENLIGKNFYEIFVRKNFVTRGATLRTISIFSWNTTKAWYPTFVIYGPENCCTLLASFIRSSEHRSYDCRTAVQSCLYDRPSSVRTIIWTPFVRLFECCSYDHWSAVCTIIGVPF